MDTQKVIPALKRHPDASRKSGDGDKSRATGLQQIQIHADGRVSVLWSWGLISFADEKQFTAYLTNWR